MAATLASFSLCCCGCWCLLVGLLPLFLFPLSLYHPAVQLRPLQPHCPRYLHPLPLLASVGVRVEEGAVCGGCEECG